MEPSLKGPGMYKSKNKGQTAPLFLWFFLLQTYFTLLHNFHNMS